MAVYKEPAAWLANCRRCVGRSLCARPAEFLCEYKGGCESIVRQHVRKCDYYD